MILIKKYLAKTIFTYGLKNMSFKEKYYIECSLKLLLEVSEENREKVMKKINGIISSALKNEKVIHVSKDINLISEHDIILSMATFDPDDIN